MPDFERDAGAATAGGKLLLGVRDHAYSREVCFLCGCELDDTNRSDEHIFPRWLQRKFKIRDKTIGLLNQARMAYRKLTIPCCSACNNGHLSALERRVARWLERPVRELTRDQERDLFLWASKILFGLLYRQLFVFRDPRDRRGEKIIDSEAIKHFEHMHRLLQGIRTPLVYSGPTPHPGSFAVFEVHCPPDLPSQFDWIDSPATQTLYVRLGTRAVLLSHDGGAQMIAVGDIIARHQGRPLHPLQMEELAAKFLYKEVLLQRWPVFTLADDGRLFVACLGFDYPEARTTIVTLASGDADGDGEPTEITSIAIPHPNDDERPLFGDWVREEYFQLFSRTTRLPERMLGGEDGTTATWLITLDDKDLILDFEMQPYPL